MKKSIQYTKFNLKNKYLRTDAWHPPSTLCRKKHIDHELVTQNLSKLIARLFTHRVLLQAS